MKLLLDTHVLLWAAASPNRLSGAARELISDPRNDLFFSSASFWEIAIKQSLGRSDFQIDARPLLLSLLANDYRELAVTSAHALEVSSLPPLHKDPFDRVMVAQARVEGAEFITHDKVLARYGSAVRLV